MLRTSGTVYSSGAQEPLNRIKSTPSLITWGRAVLFLFVLFMVQRFLIVLAPRGVARRCRGARRGVTFRLGVGTTWRWNVLFGCGAVVIVFSIYRVHYLSVSLCVHSSYPPWLVDNKGWFSPK